MFIFCNINLDRYLKKFHKDGAKRSAVATKKNSLKKTLSQTKNCSHVNQNVVDYSCERIRQITFIKLKYFLSVK